jgi:hypothetical protein
MSFIGERDGGGRMYEVRPFVILISMLMRYVSRRTLECHYVHVHCVEIQRPVNRGADSMFQAVRPV